MEKEVKKVEEKEIKKEETAPTNGTAIAGFVLSLVSFMSCGLTSLVGLILSIIGIKKSKDLKDSGKGLSIAGIIISSITLFAAILLIILMLAGALSFTKKSTSVSDIQKRLEKEYNLTTTTTTTMAEEENYVDLASTFNEVTLDEYLQLLNGSEKSIVLIARPTCYYCEKFAPILKEAMEDMNLTINYIDTDKLSSDDMDKLEDSASFFKKESESWGTPTVLIVQNGDSIADNEGYTDLTSIKKFFSDNGY